MVDPLRSGTICVQPAYIGHNYLEGDVGETGERWAGALMGLSKTAERWAGAAMGLSKHIGAIWSGS